MTQTDVQLIFSETETTSKRSIFVSLTALFVTYFLYNLYANCLNVAQPKIAADLNGMALYSWAVSIPALASALVTLIFGKLSDMFGRRTILMIAMVFFLAGVILAAISPSFVFNIAARFIICLGQGALAPLCFSVIGDLFPPAERSRWSGLMAIPAGLTALVGPTLAGILTDNLNWRYLFWVMAPLVLISGVLVWVGIPSIAQKTAHKIDLLGAFLLAIASATMILAFSLAGSQYPWASIQIIGLLMSSVLFWGVFIWYEGRIAEPILEPQILTNRTFMTAALAAFISFFGLMGIMMYYPLYLQGLQNVSTTLSGQMYTPFALLMAFMGVPAGMLLAKTKRYKWMYVVSYAILTGAMFGMVTFQTQTPGWFSVLVTALAGLGVGIAPTVNALVAQFSLPKRLLGVAVGAMYFFVMMGSAIAPSILGSLMNTAYIQTLQSTLPAELSQQLDPTTLASLNDPRILLSPSALAALQGTFDQLGRPDLFEQVVQTIRIALETCLKKVFLIGAVTMFISFLMILTIPEISIEAGGQDKKTQI